MPTHYPLVEEVCRFLVTELPNNVRETTSPRYLLLPFLKILKFSALNAVVRAIDLSNTLGTIFVLFHGCLGYEEERWVGNRGGRWDDNEVMKYTVFKLLFTALSNIDIGI